MSIAERDELEHPALGDWLWRESLYLNFHDARGQVSGMTTIGIRTNQNQAQSLAAILRPGELALMYGASLPLDAPNVSLYSAGAITYELLAPLKWWRVRVQGDFVPVDPRHVRGQEPSLVPVRLDVTFDAVDPAYEYSPDDIGPISGRAHHYEQNGHIEGTVVVGDQQYAIAGLGTRDHSWGLRDLSKAGDIVVIYAPFSPHLAINAISGQGDGRESAAGYVFDDGVSTPVNTIRTVVGRDPANQLPTTLQAEIGTVDGRWLALEGTVVSVLPIPLKQGDDQLLWCECQMRLCHAGQVAYGTMEVTKLFRGAASSRTAEGRDRP